MNNVEDWLNIVWPEWKIEEIIGAGSFSKVYRIARESYGKSQVSALKVLEIPNSINDDETAVLRSQGQTDSQISDYYYGMVEDVIKEVELMYKLQGISNIVSYQDHAIVKKEEDIGWFIFIRMELLTKLNDVFASEDLTAQDGIKIGMDLCRALEICENNNIIHRDIKPANIFRSVHGDYKLGDFGIARQLEKTVSGMTSVGTIPYMAPEVYRGMPYNMSVDIYSLGILLYQLFNNMRGPFYPPITEPRGHSDEPKALALRMSGAEMNPPCNAGKELSDIILKACAFNPEDRYKDADELYKDLDQVRQLLPEVIITPTVERKEEDTQAEIVTIPISSVGESSGFHSGERFEKKKESPIKKKDEPKDEPDTSTATEMHKNSRIAFIGMFSALAVICVFVMVFFVRSRFLNNSDLDDMYVDNTCTKDVSGIIFQMQNFYGNNVMKDAKIYELSMGTYGYVIQTKNEDLLQYSFLLPRADKVLKEETTDTTGLFHHSMQSGVLYMMPGMIISQPATVDNSERVVINNQSLILSEIILSECPEIDDGYPALAFLITDDEDKIRRIMLLTSDGFLVRSDYTYDYDNRIIKAHWTSVWMGKEQWQILGWYSQDEDRMIAPISEIEDYIKKMIVSLPKDFVNSSPSGVNSDTISIYGYDEQSFLKEVDYKNGKKRIVWDFSYDNGLRKDAVRNWSDEGVGDEAQNYFIYERDKDGLVVRVDYDDTFMSSDDSLNNTVGSGFEYSYNDDGTMSMDIAN